MGKDKGTAQIETLSKIKDPYLILNITGKLYVWCKKVNLPAGYISNSFISDYVLNFYVEERPRLDNSNLNFTIQCMD